MTDAATPNAAELIREARMHQAALEHHRAEARKHLQARDDLIHQLRESDPIRWSYAQIGEAVGLKPVTVVKILRKPAPIRYLRPPV